MMDISWFAIWEGKKGKGVFLGKDYFYEVLKMINCGFEDYIIFYLWLFML